MNGLIPAVCLASATSAPFLASGAINAETNVPLGPALAAFVFVAGLVWWLAQKLKGLDSANEHNAESNRMILDELRALKTDLASRPCQKTGECKEGKK